MMTLTIFKIVRLKRVVLRCSRTHHETLKSDEFLNLYACRGLHWMEPTVVAGFWKDFFYGRGKNVGKNVLLEPASCNLYDISLNLIWRCLRKS